MRRILLASIVLAGLACRHETKAPSYLFVWAGDSTEKTSDFLAVIDADPSSPAYATVVTSLPTGVAGTHPHHTEAEMPSDGHLLANGFHAGRTWLFDLTDARRPKILASFGALAGYSNPHTFLRLPNGNVLATFQYKEDANAPAPMHGAGTMPMAMPAVAHTTGGLVEMDERGTVIRSGSAVDGTIADKRIFPYSVIEIPGMDRAVSTTTDMDEADTVATSEWVQFWKRSDLTLRKSIALPPGPRGDEQKHTGEPHLLPDGKSVYIHTFNCGLYLVRGIDGAAPTATFVKGFPGKDCGVPILTGHWWLQPVPASHALVAVDIADPEHPRDVSSVTLADEEPHWIALDPTGRRVVLNSGGYAKSNRLYVIDFDPATGTLTLDEKFRDAGSSRAGVSMSARAWPHGFTGTAMPHGTVFSR